MRELNKLTLNLSGISRSCGKAFLSSSVNVGTASLSSDVADVDKTAPEGTWAGPSRSGFDTSVVSVDCCFRFLDGGGSVKHM